MNRPLAILAAVGAFVLGFALVVVWSQILLSTADRAEVNIQETGQPADRLYPNFIYGMQVDVGNDKGRAFDMMKDAGFNWTKVQVRWDGIEPQRGQYQWQVLDNVADETARANVNILFSVVDAPEWARPADTDRSVPGPPADPQDMARFLAALAERYKGRVQAYEIWNEQNLWYEWGGAGKMNAGEYVRLLQAAYPAIKAVDPDAKVIVGALTPAGDVADAGGVRARDDRAFLREMFQAGMMGFYDAIGVHPSGFNNPPRDDPQTNTTTTTDFKGNWSFYYRNFENYRRIQEEFGDTKPLWFTEFGWASANPAPRNYPYAAQVTEAQQAEYLAEAIRMARESGYVEAVFLWNLNFAPGAEPDDDFAKRAFSIIRTDWTPRPAYEALKNLPK